MSMNELQKQTNANIQAKANLIWEIATHLVGLFKPHEYGKVILPMTVLKRFDDALKETKDAVVEMAKKLDEQHVEGAARDGILCTVAKRDFYNTSSFDFAKLIVEPDKIEDYFEEYLQGFSDNVKDIIENFDFDNTVKLMVKGGVLFVTLQEFNSAKADMSPDKITSADMGYIFEELIRKFSESYDEQAGAHFTKVTVETAQVDEDGKPILKKGKKQPVKGATDTEIIPLSEDIVAYMEKNVLPYNPNAYIDSSKNKEGYEVPFTRLFYKFEAPASSESISEEIKELEAEETILMKELFGNA